MESLALAARNSSNRSPEFFQKTLDSLQAHIAVLDEGGVIVAVNLAWKRFALTNDLIAEFCGPGANYLAACDNATGDCSDEARIVSAGIHSVIHGEAPEFYLEYPCHSPDEQRWFSVRVTRFVIADTIRVVVTHDDITARKLAELSLLAINKRLSAQAATDGLTGVGNRRAFDDNFQQAWSRCQQTNQSVSILLIDVDYFKEYNDNAGHLAGDDCLKSVATTIRSITTGRGHFVARFGGDELAVILSRVEAAQARHFAEIICAEIRTQRLPHPQSLVSSFVTVSIGVATLTPDSTADLPTLLRLADAALYRAKMSGRNRVSV